MSQYCEFKLSNGMFCTREPELDVLIGYNIHMRHDDIVVGFSHQPISYMAPRHEHYFCKLFDRNFGKEIYKFTDIRGLTYIVVGFSHQPISHMAPRHEHYFCKLFDRNFGKEIYKFTNIRGLTYDEVGAGSKVAISIVYDPNDEPNKEHAVYVLRKSTLDQRDKCRKYTMLKEQMEMCKGLAPDDMPTNLFTNLINGDLKSIGLREELEEYKLKLLNGYRPSDVTEYYTTQGEMYSQWARVIDEATII